MKESRFGLRVVRFLFCMLIFNSFLLQFTPVYGKELITQEEWVEQTKELNYTESYLDRKIENRKSPFHFGNFGFNFEYFKIFIFILIVGVLLFFIVRLVLRNLIVEPRAKKKKKNYTIEDVEEDIQQGDLQLLLEDALKQKQYLLALRIHYLMVLRVMDTSGLINWQKDKTNGDYVVEVSSHVLNEDFRFLTKVFEKVWYGDAIVSEAEYKSMSIFYLSFTKKILPHEV